MGSAEIAINQSSIDQLITDEALGLKGCGDLTYEELFTRYAASDFGTTQAAQPARFSNRYAYDRNSMIADLGADVHPLLHMPYTANTIFQPLVEYQHADKTPTVERFERLEIVAGRLGALLHDTGECEHPELKERFGKTVGDVNVFDKTTEHEKDEAAIRAYFYERFFSDVPAEILELAEDMIANNSGTRLREAFCATERLGYFMTGVRAGGVALAAFKQLQETSSPDPLEEHRFQQLRALAIQTTSSWEEELLERGKQFPYVTLQVHRLQPSVEHIQKELTD